MPLSSGKDALRKELEALYGDVKAFKSVAEFARRKASAVNDFVLTGEPKTLITFTNPATGTGIGGLDKPAPGMGLAAAQPIMMAKFIEIWTHGNAVKSPAEFAQKMSEAIFTYYSQAMVLTTDVGPLTPPPGPPPPLTGSSTGIGGVLSSAPGSGYAAAKPTLEAEFKRIWSQVQSAGSVPKYAQELALAIHQFAIQGKVTTNGVIVTGAGQSVSSTLS